MGRSMIAGMTVVLCVLAGCGGPNYDDIRSVADSMSSACDAFAASVDNAKSAKDVAAELEQFGKRISDITAKAKDLEKKYPQFKSGKDLPPELQESKDKMEAAAKKMMGAMMKVTLQYGQDPEVMKAMKSFQQGMMSMAPAK